MGSLRALLVTVLLAAGLVLAAPAPQAVACSCAMVETPGLVEGSAVVFRGVVAEVQRDRGSAVYTFDVDSVFRGTTTATTEIESSPYGASCGLEGVDEGGEYVVFAYRTPGREQLQSGLCSGTGPATQNLVRQVEAVTGPGVAPQPTAGGHDLHEPAQPWIPYWAMGGIGAGVVLLGVGVVALRRRARS